MFASLAQNWKQFILIPIIALAVLLVWDFAQRATLFARLNDRQQTTQQQLTTARATQTALVERKAYVQTDQYAESAMRADGWARAGDTVARAPATPTAIPVAQTRPSAPPAAKSWLDLLFEFVGWK